MVNDWPQKLAEMTFENQLRWAFLFAAIFVGLMMLGMRENSYE